MSRLDDAEVALLGELLVQTSATTVRLHGELDLVTADALRALLAEAAAEKPAKVVVDITDVPFVDVISLSTILAAAAAMRERGAGRGCPPSRGGPQPVCAPVVPGAQRGGRARACAADAAHRQQLRSPAASVSPHTVRARRAAWASLSRDRADPAMEHACARRSLPAR